MLQAYAIILPIIVLLCGLAIDVGMLELKESQMQTAADAAAISAELEAERGTGNWVTLGQEDAAVNGFTNGVNSTSVSVTEGASFGAYSGRNDGLQVTITQPVKTIFMGSLNGGYTTASASSVAQITPCVYLLGTGTLQNQSFIVYTGSVNATTCPIDTNSMDVESNGHVAVEAINVVASSASISGYVYPTPHYNAPAMSDPLTAISSPSFSGTCNNTSTSITSGAVTLNPGTYCKGLNISGGTVTLNPGLYVITGGGTWKTSTVNGTGVTLFFTTGGGSSYGTFVVQNATLNLSAPLDNSNGGTPGVLLFADRNWTATGGQDFQFISDTITIDGILYLKAAGLEIWSCGTLQGTHYLGVVADNIFTAGTIFTPANNYSYVVTGNPFRTQSALVQ